MNVKLLGRERNIVCNYEHETARQRVRDIVCIHERETARQREKGIACIYECETARQGEGGTLCVCMNVKLLGRERRVSLPET